MGDRLHTAYATMPSSYNLRTGFRPVALGKGISTQACSVPIAGRFIIDPCMLYMNQKHFLTLSYVLLSPSGA